MNARDALIIRDGTDRSELAVVPLSEAAMNAIGKVIAAHEDEFRVAVGAEGIDWGDVLQPEWYRGVRIEDAQAAIERSQK